MVPPLLFETASGPNPTTPNLPAPIRPPDWCVTAPPFPTITPYPAAALVPLRIDPLFTSVPAPFSPTPARDPEMVAPA